jgi:hypothetical protein
LKIGTLRIAGLVLATAVPAVAQVRPMPPANTAQIQARHEIAALEGVLENAVQYGARMLMQSVQASNVPDMVTLTGMARARGFRLDGYGVLFDVEFPSIRRSVMWSMRALQRPDPELLAAMKELRKNMQGVGDAGARQELDRTIREMEAQMKAYDAQAIAQNNQNAQKASSGGGGLGAMAASNNPGGGTMMAGAVSDPKTDPKGVYLNEITNALIDAILDHGAPVGVGADEWLTVAARESADRGFVPNDPNDTAMTFILRIKGSDLKALQERRLTKDEARKKVEMKQY